MQLPVGGPPRPLIKAGNHVARLYSIVDLGTHPDVYQGIARTRHTIQFSWELPTLMHDFGKGVLEPMALSRKFTASMHSKAGLRQFIDGWRGKALSDAQAAEFKIETMLGKTCLLKIVHGQKQDGSPRADVSSASVLMEGQECPAPVNKPIFYELKYGVDPKSPYGRLPKWQQEIIATSLEITKPDAVEQAEHIQTEPPDDKDDCPF